MKSIYAKHKKKIWLAVILAAIVVISAVFALSGDENGGMTFAKVKKGKIVQEVLVSGTIKPKEEVNLAFEKSGRISVVNKKVGEYVYAGELISSLENGIEQASLEDARAKLKSDKSSLTELKRGSRVEDIKIKESELAKATQDLRNYFESVAETVNDAFNKSDNAITRQVDVFFTGGAGSNPTLSFNTANTQNMTSAKDGRILAGINLQNFRLLNDSVLSSALMSDDEKLKSLTDAKSYLINILSFLIKMSAVVNDATNITDSVIATYKDNVSTGRTNVNTALQSISALAENIASQKISVEKISRELELVKAGETTETIEQAESLVARSEAGVKSANASLLKTILISPINGIVTKQDAKIGEIVPANTSLVTVMSAKDFKIEAALTEADLSKVKVGNKATFTLDAFGNDLIFDATLTQIDPAEKIIDGVPTYKVTFEFSASETKIKSGMTANLTIKTAEIDGALLLPFKSVLSKDDRRYVKILSGESVEEKDVKIGLRGSDGNIEIVSGLSENDEVILSNN